MDPIGKLMGLRYKSHPWHGVEIGDEAPEVVTTFIEMVTSDTMKYEVDKVTGYLKVDRPQKYSNVLSSDSFPSIILNPPIGMALIRISP